MNELPQAELQEWMAFHSIEPFGEERADMRAGIIASTIDNMIRMALHAFSGKKGRKPKPSSPLDYMPFREKPKQQPAKQLRASLAHLVVKKDPKDGG